VFVLPDLIRATIGPDAIEDNNLGSPCYCHFQAA